MNQGGDGNQGSSSSVQSRRPRNKGVRRARVSEDLEAAVKYEKEHGRTLDPNMETKKLRRTISNRLAAGKARLRQKDYIAELEKKIRELEVSNKLVSTKIEGHRYYQKHMKRENEDLEKRIAICTQKFNAGEGLKKANLAEKAALKKIHLDQEIESWLNCDDYSESLQIGTPTTDDQLIPPSSPFLNLDQDISNLKQKLTNSDINNPQV